MSSSSDISIGVRELSALLQCLGFKKEWNISQEEGSRTVVISCQEFGGALLKSLVKSQREHLVKNLQEIVRCVQDQNKSDVEKKQEPLSNKLDLKTPEQRPELSYETPSPYRSLDTLSSRNDQLPIPGAPKKFVYKRQSSSPTFETSTILKETSSSNQVPLQSILKKLTATEKVVEDLQKRMSKLDVSKFSVLKDVRIGVIELSALLQCLGFSMRSLDTKEGNISQEEGSSTVVISCQEFGRALLKSLVKSQRERLLKDLQHIVRCIQDHNKSDVEKKQEPLSNKMDLKTPEQRPELSYETPTPYRSLDTLSSRNDQLPIPGAPKKFVYKRQSSSPTFETSTILKETSSSNQVPLQSILKKLTATEKVVEDLQNRKSNLNVSRISVLKGSKMAIIKCVSTPNLFELGVALESASTDNVMPKSPPKDGKISKLKQTVRFKNSPNILIMKNKSQDKLNDLSKPKILPPVRKPTINLDGNPNLCVSRKKFSHVKSTIPKLVSKKK